MPASFLFYDLETFGKDPRTTRIAQFAAIRTDADLNEVEAPISVYVQPADDLLPSPGATLVTGITPQQALRDGIREADAFALIHDEMARPETCSLGYNSLRFDDEFIRFGLFRNFYDPYEREWRGGNTRWDLLDVLRMAHALRPEGLVWPRNEKGDPSFKLEHLAEANGVREGDAHEALSDVRALIGLARKLKTAQPRLWEYALRLRDKRFAASLVDVAAMTPLLHVSQRYPASRLCAAPVLPLARHPKIDNRIIVFDLTQDPKGLLERDADEIAATLYLRAEQLPEGQERVALKELHLNRCPALMAWQHLRQPDFERLGILPDEVAARAEQLQAVGPAIAEKVRRIFAKEEARAPADADASLYDGFLGDGDKRLFQDVRTTPPEALGQRNIPFRDARLPELLFRYRARNWPDNLSAGERQRWDAYRSQRLRGPVGLSEYTFETVRHELADLRARGDLGADRLALLDAVEAWTDRLDAALP
ncbi:exodeoxyribonuclease I [Aerolutibacter ruishenii]|uniref:Exodeoxyribonuclease I n=1 Tax=Aerolutibacter ruishenii TaxID=686800 RepID=A0A562LYG4_9GAMM|nr:exodeoxyribonuclease I [Lysobacter ruishenii]TWI12684.1 exodeoxyribonuclease I subunit C [Lysobacter ruishenii]